MADASSIETPASYYSTPATSRNFENFGLSDSKSVPFCDKKKKFW